jgi:long-chain acyl-CoA synthetase
VRRRVIADRYGDIIAALYSGSDRVEVDAMVTFEDGREGHVTASLAITDLKPHAALDRAA